MHLSFLTLLRCPVTRSSLKIEVISKARKNFGGSEEEIINEAILFAEEDWFYPVINGIPRLIVEAFHDYADFLAKHLPDYQVRRAFLEEKYPRLIRYVLRKNRRTKTELFKRMECLQI